MSSRTEPRGAARGAWLDLGGLTLLFVVATAVKAVVLVVGLGMDPRHLPYDDPRLYLVEFFTPLIVLPGLTLLLHRRGTTWAELGAGRPELSGRFWLLVAAHSLYDTLRVLQFYLFS